MGSSSSAGRIGRGTCSQHLTRECLCACGPRSSSCQRKFCVWVGGPLLVPARDPLSPPPPERLAARTACFEAVACARRFAAPAHDCWKPDPRTLEANACGKKKK